MKVRITYFPYYYQDGVIDVPKKVIKSDTVREYIEEHFDDVVFGELEIDEAESEGCFKIDYDYDDEE